MVDTNRFISSPFEMVVTKADIVETENPSSFYCRLAYPSHKGGCPMLGRNECPPNSKPLFQLVDPEREMKLVAVRFDVGEYAFAKAREPLHKDDSFAQLRNSRHWQNAVDAKLKQVAYVLTADWDDKMIIKRPEAHGVDVFETCRRLGIHIEHNPLHNPKKDAYVTKVVFVGHDVNKRRHKLEW